MSAAGGVGSAAGGEAPGAWASCGAGLRLLAGWFSVAIALLNLLAELGRVPDRAYLLFHVLLLVGGSLLISFGWGAAGAGRAGYAGFGVMLTAGTLLSALPANHATCCMTGYPVRHGYPFTFLARDGAGRWHADSPHLVADLLFWGYAGLIVLVLVAMTRRITEHHGGGRN